MFTGKAILYFCLALGIFSLAILLRDFQLGVLALGLASLFFLGNVWGLPEKIRLELSRQIVPDETFGNEEIRIESSIQSLTKGTLANLEIKEYLPNGVTLEKGTGDTMMVLKPLAREALIQEFPSPRRGNYQLGPLIARARDPYGFYLVEKRLEPDTLSVMPRPERVRGTSLNPRQVGSWPGTIPSKARGLGTEFYGIRQYLPGDDPRRINWKASARKNDLMVNETEAERVTDVMILLDTDVGLLEGLESDIFERGVSAAASIASLLLRQGNRVGLVLQGGERGSLPPGFGKRQERRILYLLADAEPGHSSVSTSYVVNLLARRMLPSGAQIIVISPLLDPELRNGVRDLSTAEHSVLVLSLMPALPTEFGVASDKIAFDLAMLERSITMISIEKSAAVVNWPEGIPLSKVIAKVRRQRAIIMA